MNRDEAIMQVAVELARQAIGRTTPNPAVGAVIVRDGEIVARGFHAYAGADHAEVAALRQLNFQAQDCELFSTLEPCNHQGRTGPCAEAILLAGIRRVVIGTGDPNPLVSGRGAKRLVRAGVEVQQNVLEQECRMLNEPFNYAIVHHRPFVVLKTAQSLDGRIATATGDSKWITSKPARAQAHRLRDRLDAVLVGVQTVLADDPKLTVRFRGGRNPVRIVLDSRLRIPEQSHLVQTAHKTRTMVATTARAPKAKARRLMRAGIEVLTLAQDQQGRVDLGQLLESIYAYDLNSVLVEGGSEVHGSFVAQRLVNKIHIFMAPKVIGGRNSVGSVGGSGAPTVAEALDVVVDAVTPIGADMLITAYPRR